MRVARSGFAKHIAARRGGVWVEAEPWERAIDRAFSGPGWVGSALRRLKRYEWRAWVLAFLAQ
jgi:hypothetical protein